MNAIPVYYALAFSASLFFSIIITINLVYQTVTVGLDPLQLVLIGTILEGTVFLFEIPTGVVADLKSRKLSIIIGYLLIGLGFVIEGSLPYFAAVALAQVVWGLGATFTSGAIQAWVVDEVGERRAGPAFIRGAQLRQAGAFLGIPLSVALAGISLSTPVVLGGALTILLSVFLLLTMPEDGFKPTPLELRNTWPSMLATTKEAYQMTKRQPVLPVIFMIALFYGLYSEGVDRLWVPHMLGNFTFPAAERLGPAIWFGAIRAVSLLLSIAGIELAKRYTDLSDTTGVIRTLMTCAGFMMLFLSGFALAVSFIWALALYWLFGVMRSITGPLENIWINRNIDNPKVRATVISASAQVDAIGQVCGGPPIGAVGRAFSTRAAFLASAALLTPVLPLYRRASKLTRPVASRPTSR